MTSSTKTLYAGHRFPPELISYTVWLYYRFPLSLRMVEAGERDDTAADGIEGCRRRLAELDDFIAEHSKAK